MATDRPARAAPGDRCVPQGRHGLDSRRLRRLARQVPARRRVREGADAEDGSDAHAQVPAAAARRASSRARSIRPSSSRTAWRSTRRRRCTGRSARKQDGCIKVVMKPQLNESCGTTDAAATRQLVVLCGRSFGRRASAATAPSRDRAVPSAVALVPHRAHRCRQGVVHQLHHICERPRRDRRHGDTASLAGQVTTSSGSPCVHCIDDLRCGATAVDRDHRQRIGDRKPRELLPVAALEPGVEGRSSSHQPRADRGHENVVAGRARPGRRSTPRSARTCWRSTAPDGARRSCRRSTKC